MSEAERLADALDSWHRITLSDVQKAAAELRRLSAELDALKAAMGEPVAWICEEQTIGPAYGKKRLTFSKYYSDNPLHYKHTPLYTHPAPQQKPLLFSEIWDNDAIMEVNADARLPFEMIERFARAIEAAHNIGEKK